MKNALNIRELIVARIGYEFTQNGQDSLLDATLIKSPERFFIVTYEKTVEVYKQKGKLNSYYITGIFSLFPSTGRNRYNQLSLFVFSKKETLSIKTANIKKSKDDRIKKWLPEVISQKEYIECYYDYLSNIENWVNSAITPTNTEYYDYFNYPSVYFKSEMPYARRYTRETYAVYKALQDGVTTALENIASIYLTQTAASHDGKEKKVLTSEQFIYPLDESLIEYQSYGTDFELKKNDIIITPRGKSYLIKSDFTESTYSGNQDIVIRCTAVCPEFLYLYLNSDLAKTLIDSFRSQVSVFHPVVIKISDLKTIPIVMPSKCDQYYSSIFNSLYYNYSSVIELYKDIYKCPKTADTEVETLEQLFNNELQQRFTAVKNEKAQHIINNDFIEMKKCYKAKAYKATLIMAGSILEALLLDWLTELDGIDYFTTEYQVKNANGDIRNGNLSDYIAAIKRIKRPKWMVEAEKAFTIKNKRNLVHAKLCINNEIDINDDTCQQVIGFLNDIINTRYDGEFIRNERH